MGLVTPPDCGRATGNEDPSHRRSRLVPTDDARSPADRSQRWLTPHRHAASGAYAMDSGRQNRVVADAWYRTPSRSPRSAEEGASRITKTACDCVVSAAEVGHRVANCCRPFPSDDASTAGDSTFHSIEGQDAVCFLPAEWFAVDVRGEVSVRDECDHRRGEIGGCLEREADGQHGGDAAAADGERGDGRHA